MLKGLRCLLFFLLLNAVVEYVNAQSPLCDSNTPFFKVDLTGDPAGTYISPQVSRVGNCCGTTHPDRCISFEVTLDSTAVGLHFAIASGAEPPGALYYQVNCGPEISITEPVCLSGGPHILTFCKPGANQNTYAITSIPGPEFPVEDTTRDGCSVELIVSGLVPSTITWNDITSPDSAYNAYLDCTVGCEQTLFTPDQFAPSFVEYEVCGYVYGGICSPAFKICDTVKVNVVNDMSVEVIPNPAVFCHGADGVLLNSQIHGSDGNFTFFWRDESGDLVGTDSIFVAPEPGIYTIEARDGFYPSCPPVFDTALVLHHEPMELEFQSIPVSCFGYSDGSASVEVQGSSGPYQYEWDEFPGQNTDSITNLSSGNYIVKVVDSFGCIVEGTVEVLESSQPLTISLNISPVSCYGGDDGSAVVMATGGVDPYIYIWNGDTIENGATLNNISAGNYFLQLIDAYGCEITSTTHVSEPDSITGITTVEDVSCYGGDDGSISLQLSGGTLPYQIDWNSNPVQQGEVATNLSAGFYEAFVTDANGCTAILSDAVSEPYEPIALNAEPTHVSCYQGNDGSVNLDVTGGTAPYHFLWSNGDSAQYLEQLSSGSYSVIVTDAMYCYHDSLTINIEEPDPIQISFEATDVQCYGGSDGTATAIVEGGSGGYSFLWNSIPDQNQQTATGLEKGMYSVTVTDSLHCTMADSIFIDEPTPIDLLDVQTQPVSCFGGSDGSVEMMFEGGTPPYALVWNQDTITGVLQVNGLEASQYEFEVFDANGCLIFVNAEVSSPEMLNVSSVSTPVSCFGYNDGSIEVFAEGGTAPYAYSWSTSPGQNHSEANNLFAGNYTVTVTDANECQVQLTDSVVQPWAPISMTTQVQHVSCSGGCDGEITLEVTGGTYPYQFLWSDGDTSSTKSNLKSGIYEVTVMDANSCHSAETNIFVQHPFPVLVSGNVTDISCYGYSDGKIQLTVMGGTPPYQMNWSDSTIGNENENLQAGTYTVEVVDENNCLVSKSYQINEPAPLELEMTAGDETCDGKNNGWIVGNASGGTQPYLFLWSNGMTGKSILEVPPGIYSLVVRDQHNCEVASDAEVQSGPLPEPLNLSPVLSCTGDSVKIQLSETFTYQWDAPENGFLSCDDCNSPVLYAQEKAVYHVHISIPEVPNCKITDSVVIELFPNPEILSPPDTTLCPGESITVLIEGADSLVWDNLHGVDCHDCNHVQITPENEGYYQVTAYNSHGCKKEVSFNLGLNPTPDLFLSKDTVVCKGTEVVLSAQNSDSLLADWFSDEGNLIEATDQIQISPDSTTKFLARVVNEFGCSTEQSVVVSVVDEILLSSQSSKAVCPGEQITLHGFAELPELTDVVWTPQISEGSDSDYLPVIIANQDMHFMVTGSGEACETYVHEFVIHVYPKPSVEIDIHQDLQNGVNSLLSFTSGTQLSYNWTPAEFLDCNDCESPVILYPGQRMYKLTVTNEYGCTANDSLSIFVPFNCKESIFVPNTFTPNHDERNDKLFVRGLEIDELKFFRVYNRWGELVFETNQMHHGWDGRFNGKMLSPDVFAYHVMASCKNGGTVELTGNVTLLR